MNKRSTNRILAYIYMPVFFSLIGAGIVALALLPFWNLISSAASVVLSDDAPTFDTNLRVIYADPGVNETEPVSGEDTSYIPLSEVQWPVFGDLYGELTCEAAGIDAPVYFGDNSDILREGVGTYIGSFIPGYGRPILLSGHDTTYFLPLQYVEVGNVFTFKTSYAVYEYKVTNIEISDHNDFTAYDLGLDSEQLIMYTCYPFEKMVGRKTDRLFIYAERISGPDLREEGS